ncbi:putative toxin-antitoxin system toxin component, PIN family [Leptospira ognonensis]|uniref:Putative toxin-antitoxin system toxin component, PIN family n=1 Tax=Leptospira ognonensis TaxID=2484945 RepID=A0A4R9K6D5_9LEPT|nr:putative toxin-antitoxin system toxin component, PIN family [Leptospira ognonensis]TGL61139.1 putative toxin-antitoxin system toxin component, PIN family [Leptospira ognonensis]
MLRILLDTNIYVSAILFKGKPRLVLQELVDERVLAFISNEILKELEDTLSKPKFKLNNDFVQLVLSEIRDITKLISISPLNSYLELRDRNDYHILETAYSAKVDFLVTGDKDILSLKSITDFKIVPPEEFLRIKEEDK